MRVFLLTLVLALTLTIPTSGVAQTLDSQQRKRLSQAYEKAGKKDLQALKAVLISPIKELRLSTSKVLGSPTYYLSCLELAMGVPELRKLSVPLYKKSIDYLQRFKKQKFVQQSKNRMLAYEKNGYIPETLIDQLEFQAVRTSQKTDVSPSPSSSNQVSGLATSDELIIADKDLAPFDPKDTSIELKNYLRQYRQFVSQERPDYKTGSAFEKIQELFKSQPEAFSVDNSLLYTKALAIAKNYESRIPYSGTEALYDLAVQLAPKGPPTDRVKIAFANFYARIGNLEKVSVHQEACKRKKIVVTNKLSCLELEAQSSMVALNPSLVLQARANILSFLRSYQSLSVEQRRKLLDRVLDLNVYIRDFNAVEGVISTEYQNNPSPRSIFAELQKLIHQKKLKLAKKPNDPDPQQEIVDKVMSMAVNGYSEENRSFRYLGAVILATYFRSTFQIRNVAENLNWAAKMLKLNRPFLGLFALPFYFEKLIFGFYQDKPDIVREAKVNLLKVFQVDNELKKKYQAWIQQIEELNAQSLTKSESQLEETRKFLDPNSIYFSKLQAMVRQKRALQ